MLRGSNFFHLYPTYYTNFIVAFNNEIAQILKRFIFKVDLLLERNEAQGFVLFNQSKIYTDEKFKSESKRIKT